MTDMWDVVGDKKLASLWLPGSHGSGTFELGDEMCSATKCVQACTALTADLGLVKKLSISQTQTLDEQATLSGVRYFDLRLYASDNGEAWFVHCYLSSGVAEYHLSQLAAAIMQTNSSKEVYILNFYQFLGSWNTATYTRLISNLITIFNGTIVKATPDMTLKQIVGAGGGPKVILLWNGPIYDDASEHYLTDQEDWLERPYDGVNNQWSLIGRNAAYYSQYASVMQAADKLFVMEGVLTPEQSDVDVIAADSAKWGDEVQSELIKWQNGVNWAVLQNMHVSGWAGAGKPGMVVLLDDVRATHSASIVRANLPSPPPPPAMWSFGHCSATYQWDTFTCGGSDASRCAPGYADYSFYRAGLCYCQCVKQTCRCYGDDCECEFDDDRGCGGAAQTACP